MAQEYNKIDHSHCWQSDSPPCGLKGKHRCCLCTEPVPHTNDKVREGLTKILEDFSTKVESHDFSNGLSSWMYKEKDIEVARKGLLRLFNEKLQEIEKKLQEEMLVSPSQAGQFSMHADGVNQGLEIAFEILQEIKKEII